MIKLPAERDVLLGHPVECSGGVPSLELIAGIFREVRRARGGRGSVDWRKKHKVAAGIVDASAPQGQPVVIVVEPEPVIKHKAEEALLRAFCAVAVATHAATVLASDIA